MHVISLEPFLTDLIIQYGVEGVLVGCSHRCHLPHELVERVQYVTKPGEVNPFGKSQPLVYRLEHCLGQDVVDIDRLKHLAPDVIVTSVPCSEDLLPKITTTLKQDLEALVSKPVKVISITPKTLNQTYDAFELVGKCLGVGDRGRALVHRVKAQLMDWAANFYERMKGKRVTFLSGIAPLRLGGLWIPDLIHLTSAVSQVRVPGVPHPQVEWSEVVEFRPDVIIVAPEGVAVREVLPIFKQLEKFPHWDDLPAVKRGEVFFADGKHCFYQPGRALIDSMAVVVSAIAGLESGYITPRDSFYKLRWLELHRHTIA